jgi:hypothetical protein
MDSKLIRVRLLKSQCNFNWLPARNSKGQLNITNSFEIKQNPENDKQFSALFEITIIGKQDDNADDVFDLNVIMTGEYESKAKLEMKTIENHKYQYLLPLVPQVYLHANELLTRMDIGIISIKQEFFYQALEEYCMIRETKRTKATRPTKTERK